MVFDILMVRFILMARIIAISSSTFHLFKWDGTRLMLLQEKMCASYGVGFVGVVETLVNRMVVLCWSMCSMFPHVVAGTLLYFILTLYFC